MHSCPAERNQLHLTQAIPEGEKNEVASKVSIITHNVKLLNCSSQAPVHCVALVSPCANPTGSKTGPALRVAVVASADRPLSILTSLYLQVLGCGFFRRIADITNTQITMRSFFITN